MHLRSSAASAGDQDKLFELYQKEKATGTLMHQARLGGVVSQAVSKVKKARPAYVASGHADMETWDKLVRESEAAMLPVYRNLAILQVARLLVEVFPAKRTRAKRAAHIRQLESSCERQGVILPAVLKKWLREAQHEGVAEGAAAPQKKRARTTKTSEDEKKKKKKDKESDTSDDDSSED